MRYDTKPGGKHFVNYSLRYKKILDGCGFIPFEESKHLVTKKTFWVYKRTERVNELLSLIRDSKGIDDNEIVKIYKKNISKTIKKEQIEE